MTTIWKWPLSIVDKQYVQMPIGAQILSVQMQGGSPQIWALCNPAAKPEQRVIRIYGTGNPIEADSLGHFIATFQMAGGWLVWHAFDATEKIV